MADNRLRLMRHAAAERRAVILARGARDDVHHADDERHRLRQDVEVQLRAGEHEEQHVERHCPVLHALHQLLRRRADVAEDGAGHHAHQQQGEAAVHRADLELQHGQADGQHDERDGDGHTLASGVEELLHPVKQPAHHRAEREGQHNLHNRLHDDGQDAHRAAGQRIGDAEGHGEQQQAHRVVDGDDQHQQAGHRAVRLVLAHDHHRGRRGRRRRNRAQGDRARDGDHRREAQVQRDQGDIHHDGRDHRLQDADDDRALAHGLQLLEAELIAHRERDKAQRRLADDLERLHLRKGVEAQTLHLQRAHAERAQQQSRHQIRSNRRQMNQPGQSGEHESAHHGDGQADQKKFHRFTPSFLQNAKMNGK